MKKIAFLILLLNAAFGFSQSDTLQIKVKGKIMDIKSKMPIERVTILNKNTSSVVLASENGDFEISAKTNDRLLFSHLGYNYAEVVVNQKWYSEVQTIFLCLKENEIETVLVTSYTLTGYLEIDTKLIPVNENYRYNIAGLNLGYEPGMKAKNATENLLKSLSNPVDLVYSLFNSKEKDFKKLINLKNDTHFASILSNNTNREVLVMLLQLDKNEIDKILEKCNYSKNFINTASDLQVLDALATSYNDYKVLKRK
ncbi:carboxypeptidase-like regulatory domain-containing protein [Flavobacterium sp.]|uniref:carboxypeptidase-like regulatory domain-containing protein n=1 Tax=Flavobacterium sp. TaxID=239 RepID=UPI00333E69E8